MEYTINLPFDSFTTDYGQEMFDPFTRQLKHDHVCEWLNEKGDLDTLEIGDQIQVPCSTQPKREYIFKLNHIQDNVLTFEWIGVIT